MKLSNLAPIPAAYSTVSETYDLLDELRGITRSYQSYRGNGEWLLNRPGNDTSLHEIRFRSFKPKMKPNVVEDYNDLFLTMQCTPYITTSTGGPVYKPNYQLFLSDGNHRIPFHSDMIKIYFGKTSDKLNDHLNSGVMQFLGSLPQDYKFTFGDPTDSSTFILGDPVSSLKLSIVFSETPSLVVTGTWLKIGDYRLIFVIDLMTDGWYVMSSSKELQIQQALAQIDKVNYTTTNVGVFVNGFSEVYETIKYRVSNKSLYLCSNYMNNLSTRVFVGFTEPNVRMKRTDVSSSQNYITVRLEDSNGELAKNVLEILPEIYESIVVELDWVYDKIT